MTGQQPQSDVLKMAEDAFANMVSFTKTYHNTPNAYIDPTRPELSMAGKHVVIPGGGTGIGKATAIAFAQAGAASVSILGRRKDRLEGAAKDIQSAGSKTKVIYESADFSQPEAARKGLKAVVSQIDGGKIDIFVWSAGIAAFGPMQGYDTDDFKRSMDIIVGGAFNFLQAILPIAAPGAKVINVSTGIAHMQPIPGVFSYAVAKLAALKLFDYFAVEQPQFKVFQIQPGVIKTEINESAEVQAQDDVELPGHFSVWLCTEEAEFLAGRFAWCNWDVEELLMRKKDIDDGLLLKVLLEGVPM